MNDGVKLRSELDGKDNSSEDKSSYKKVDIGDMVYNSMRMWQGANGISNFEGIVSPAYTVLKAKTNINNNYFAKLFKNTRLINEFRKNSQGLTSDTWNLKYPQIAPIKIMIPNIEEQNKIAEFFSLIDQRIEKQRQLVESLKKYKRGLLFSIFTSIQTSVKLEQISTYHSSNLTLEASQTKGDFALYDANGICSNIDTYMHDTDYVAIIKDGSGVGKLQYCKQKSSHIGTLGSLTSQSCSPYYLYTALQIIDFTKYITGMAIPHIYYKDYKKCDIPYPDRNSQNLIENTFKSIDKIITKSILNLEKLKLLKAGLLQQLFI